MRGLGRVTFGNPCNKVHNAVHKAVLFLALCQRLSSAALVSCFNCKKTFVWVVEDVVLLVFVQKTTRGQKRFGMIRIHFSQVPLWQSCVYCIYFPHSTPLDHAGVAVHLFSRHRLVSSVGHSAVACGCVHGHLSGHHRAYWCSGTSQIFGDISFAQCVFFVLSAVGFTTITSNHFFVQLFKMKYNSLELDHFML